jgi:hypothetical protein
MEDPNPVENIDRLGDLMFQTSDKSLLLRRVLWINAQLTIVWSLKHKISQPIYIFSRENSQNSESPNGPRSGLDFIALPLFTIIFVSKLVSVEMACLLVIQNKIQALWGVSKWFRKWQFFLNLCNRNMIWGHSTTTVSSWVLTRPV